MVRVDIIIPVWNLPGLTRRCLESIVRHTTLSYQLILVDNASEKPTQDLLRSFRETALSPVRLIRNEENLGNVKAVNQGIRVSNAEYVCILDNDTVVFPGWLEKMIQAAEPRKEIGIVNPGSNSLGFRKPWYFSWRSFAERVAQREKGQVVEMATGTGFCMLIKRAVIDRIGGWSEDYGMGYYEDKDYCRRAAQAGFITVHAREAFVYHEEHASFRKLEKLRKEKTSASNRGLFESRFGTSERIAFCLQKPSEALMLQLKERVLELARANHWVWVFHSGKRFPANGFPEHSNIKWVLLPKPFLSWNHLFHVLKKKKRFDRIYSDNPLLIQRLHRFRRLRGTRLESISHDPVTILSKN